jgi:hypothetical protein
MKNEEKPHGRHFRLSRTCASARTFRDLSSLCRARTKNCSSILSVRISVTCTAKLEQYSAPRSAILLTGAALARRLEWTPYIHAVVERDV